MKIFVIVDNEAGRLSQNMKILSEFGKVSDCRNLAEMINVRERDGHVDAVFLSTTIPNIKDIIMKIRKNVRDETSAAHIYLVGSLDPDSITEMFLFGVRDIIGYPILPEEVGLHKKLPSLYDDDRSVPVNFGSAPASKGKIILVCSPKGGEGKTTVATQVGASIGKLFGQTVLIDADYAGNAYRKLGMNQMTHTITEFEHEDTRNMDRHTLDSKLITHEETGLKVLCSPWNEFSSVPSSMVENALLACNRYYKNVIVDLHQGYTPTIELLKDYADDIIFVCRPDGDQMERSMEMIGRLHALEPDKLKIVINGVRDDKHLQPIRIALKEFKIKAPFYTLPFVIKELADDRKMLPVFLDPRKSEYSREIRKFLKSIGVTKTPANSEMKDSRGIKTPENEQVLEKNTAGTNLFSKILGWRSKD